MKLSNHAVHATIFFMIFAAASPANQAASAANAAKALQLKPTSALLRNDSYVLNFPHAGMVAKMTNGVSQRYETSSVRVQALGIGDLNGDGIDDAAVALVGPDEESHLKFLLNDGKRLVDVANVPATIDSDTMTISNQTVRAKFAKFDPDTLAFVRDVAAEVKLVPEPYLEADTYTVNGKSISLVSNPEKYWDALAKQVQTVKQNDEQNGAKFNKRIAIIVNGPGTYVSTSSGNPDSDSIAYSWLASAVTDFVPPQGFANIIEEPGEESLFTPRMHVEYKVNGDKITLRQTEPYKAIAFDSNDGLGQAQNESVAKDLVHQANNFAYECTRRQIQLKNGNSQDFKCRSITIGDLNGDGTPDAVVNLSSQNSGDCSEHNYIVPLLNRDGRLEQPMGQCYAIKPHDEGSAVISKISIHNGKVKVVWQACHDTKVTYATMIQLTPRLAVQEKINGKVVWTQF